MHRVGILLHSTLYLALAYGTPSLANADADRTILWYEQPATAWNEAFPIGNGRLGGMVFGGTANETFTINEDTVWSGEPRDYANVGAHEHLAQYRQLIRDEKYDEAATFGAQHMLGVPRSQAKYQRLGGLVLRFPGHESPSAYRRQLDLSTGVVSVEYQVGDAVFRREVFASHPDQVVVIRLTCDQPHRITFALGLNSPHSGAKSHSPSPSSAYLEGAADAIRFQAHVSVSCDEGHASSQAGEVTVEKANAVTILLAAATNYIDYQTLSANPQERCEAVLLSAAEISFDKLKQRHTADHRELFNRVRLDLGGTREEATLPTDRLLASVQAGRHSPLLEEQLFQFGRYLTIAGARPGTQPLNLVGIWAEGLDAPWGGKWTLNINAELNAWPAETTNLAECHKPLLALLEDLRSTGKRVAKQHYNCRGFVAHHNTDLWRGAAPVDTAIHGQWTMGGAWLCRHLWEHYDFSRDKEFLRQSYPTMREAAEFFLDYLTVDRDGYLSTCPAISFEQNFRKPDGTVGRLTYGPTMDNQILRDLFTNCIRASAVLDTDHDFAQRLKLVRSKLRPTTIDPSTGHIMEWAFPAEQDRFSGQTAALWGLSPGAQITPEDTPELAEAAARFLSHIFDRMPHYQDAGSWVTGTQLNAWARLGRREEAYATMTRAVRERVFSNLMMHFYTQKYFEIDGNMGTTAGMAEMLIQSHRLGPDQQPILHLLPALPDEWENGSVSGLRARGGFVVSIAWQEGKVQNATIWSSVGTPLSLSYAGQMFQVPTLPDGVYQFDGKTLE